LDPINGGKAPTIDIDRESERSHKPFPFKFLKLTNFNFNISKDFSNDLCSFGEEFIEKEG